jgi:hypothetical protein
MDSKWVDLLPSSIGGQVGFFLIAMAFIPLRPRDGLPHRADLLYETF